MAMDWKEKYLRKSFSTVEPMEFYRSIFPEGSLQEEGMDHYGDGKFNGIAVEITKEKVKYINKQGNEKEKPKIRRYTITDSLDTIDELLYSDNFVLLSPISYIGKSRNSENARYLHALAIDVDGITEEKHLKNLLWYIDGLGSLSGQTKKSPNMIPRPTYIVYSGTGLHYYYVFDQPIPLYPNVARSLQKYKDMLTKKIWNKYSTSLFDKIQIESLFQGFRLCGGVSKTGSRTVAFASGDKVDINYLNKFADKDNKIVIKQYDSKNNLESAKELYPEWYERVIVNKDKGKKYWKTKDKVNGSNPYALYDWWLNKIQMERSFGHRYFCIMCLSVYAMKTGVDYETLENDAMDLLEDFDSITPEGEENFTEADIIQALEMYNDTYHTFPIDTIKSLTQIEIQKNKRNYRSQDKHLEIMRATRDVLYPDGSWRYRGGRKQGSSKNKEIILKWQEEHKNGTIKECIEDTGISKTTVYRYWDKKDVEV